MRVLERFELKWKGDDPVGVRLTFRDSSTTQSFSYPNGCVSEGDKFSPLEEALAQACAANVMTFGDDQGVSQEWFDQWIMHPDGPMGERREALKQQEAVEEMASTLAGDNVSATIDGVELAGDLSGESSSEASSGSSVEVKTAKKSRKKKKRDTKLREGAGCKQPDDVFGFEAGRLLCIVKTHRTQAGRNWGRCEYRVRCNADGSYTLEFFQGNRKDVKKGDHWETASIMFKALLALPPDTMHHRMTIRRYFNLHNN